MFKDAKIQKLETEVLRLKDELYNAEKLAKAEAKAEALERWGNCPHCKALRAEMQRFMEFMAKTVAKWEPQQPAPSSYYYGVDPAGQWRKFPG